MSESRESIVAQLRPHARALFWPSVLLLAIAGAYGFFGGGLREPWQQAAAGGAAGLLALMFWLIPVWRWLSCRYTITTQRVVVRRGIVVRERQELSLSQCYDVTLRRSAGQTVFGCGDVVISSGADRPMVFRDAPLAVLVQATLHDLIVAHVADRVAR